MTISAATHCFQVSGAKNVSQWKILARNVQTFPTSLNGNFQKEIFPRVETTFLFSIKPSCSDERVNSGTRSQTHFKSGTLVDSHPKIVIFQFSVLKLDTIQNGVGKIRGMNMQLINNSISCIKISAACVQPQSCFFSP